jgi:hypothetical protein
MSCGVSRGAGGWRSRLGLLTLLAVVLGAAPLCVVHQAGFEDWPSHIARAGILHQMQGDDAFWSRFYDRNTFLLPNVALDLLLLALTDLGLPLAQAGTAALLIAYGLFVSGAGALAGSARGSRNATMLCAALLFYNGALFSGFVNFMLGCGIALWCVAVWLRIRPDAARVLIAIPFSALVFFGHLIAAGMFLVVLGAVDLAGFASIDRGRLSRIPARLSAMAGLICTAALLRLSPTDSDLAAQGGFSIAQYVRQFAQPSFYVGKAAGVLHAIFDGSGVSGSFVLIVGAIILAATFGWLRRAGQLDCRVSIAGATLACASALLFLLAPGKIGFGMGLDYRLPPFLAVCVIAWTSGGAKLRGASLLGVLLLTSVARSLILTCFAVSDAPTFESFRAVVPKIEADSVLLAGMGTPRNAIGWAEFWRPAAEYIGAEAASAHVFVPSVWALRSQHPLVLRSDFDEWGRQFDVSSEGLSQSRLAWDGICQKWRLGHSGPVYVAISYPSAASDAAISPSELVASGPGWRLIEACPGVAAHR